MDENTGIPAHGYVKEKFYRILDCTRKHRFFVVVWLVLRCLFFLTCLYLFVCSLSLMSDAFRLLAGKNLSKVFRNNTLLQNPIVNLMIGVLVTMLIHSSSTTTAIMISMAASGVATVDQAIFVVFGAEIGTSVTSTLVSVAHIANREDFRRAFAGATIQSVYNWLSILVFFPLEVSTHALRRLATLVADKMRTVGVGSAATEMLNRIIKPLTCQIIQLDKTAITHLGSKPVNQSLDNDTSLLYSSGTFLFANTGLADHHVGAIVLAVSLVVIIACLTAIAKTMHSIFAHQFASSIKKYINSDLPGCLKPLTGYLFILIGASMTFVIQSSTIFTSTLTPMIGVGLISVDRVFPLILGANIGTTGDSILAALAQDSTSTRVALTVALVQVFFNVLGVLVFYPLPFMRRAVIDTGKWLGKQTCQYRWFAAVYIIALFVVLPLSAIALSLAGPAVFYTAFVPLTIVVLVVAVLNAVQTQKPHLLPAVLQNWQWLPVWMHSLEPYDRVLSKLCLCSRCTKESIGDRCDYVAVSTNEEKCTVV